DVAPRPPSARAVPARPGRPLITGRDRLGAMLRLATVGLAAMLLWPATVGAQYPLFDAHIHYSRADWDAYTPERALSILARAWVRRALVSSTPDDGTLKLYEKSPAGIVPALRPYRTREDVGTWSRDPAVAAYVAK